MLCYTGDIHGDIYSLEDKIFSMEFIKDADLSQEEDVLLVAGDFGFIWFDEDTKEWAKTGDELYKRQQETLDKIEKMPVTIAFVDGNHENFHELFKYPIEEWNGGKVHKIRKNIVHLMRGEIFNILGKSVFAFGGAPSHDINGLATNEQLEKNYAVGVLDPSDFESRVECDKKGIFYRVKNRSWWKEEMPNDAEKYAALQNLAKHDNKVDIILTHEAPIQDLSRVSRYLTLNTDADSYRLSKFLGTIKNTVNYKRWCFGHYHKDIHVDGNDEVCYRRVHFMEEIG